MELPPPDELLEKVRRLPAGRPLLERLEGQRGLHLVGGAVRDLLLDRAPSDLDLVVEGDAESVAAHLGGDVVAHPRFGTLTVSFGGFSYHIARARRETYPRPGALPEVAPAGLGADLLRRDFTVNAIAIALCEPAPGTVGAAPLAIEDLDRRWLRVLHGQSFRDDPTRLLRLARYHARLRFAIEPDTARLAAESVREGAIDTVTGSRIGAELRLLAWESDPVGALRALHKLELDRSIHPRFGLTDEPLAERALALLPRDGRSDRLALALAALSLEAEDLRRLLDRLAFEVEDREVILAAATRAPQTARALSAAGQPSEIAAAARGLPAEAIALAGALGPESTARSWLEHLRHVKLDISGEDLLRAGVPQGPAVGRGLLAALAAKLDGRAIGRAGELAAALEASGCSG